MEVEFKCLLTKQDPNLWNGSTSEKLVKLGFKQLASQSQMDTFYAHPTRDFRKSDEVLRLRQINGHAVLTYKGAKIGDSIIKSRPELEANVDGEIANILEALGFGAQLSFKKSRARFSNADLEVVFDTIDGLATVMEIESKSGSDREIRALLSKLGIPVEAGVATSSLELALAANSPAVTRFQN